MNFKRQIEYLRPYLRPYKFQVSLSLLFVLISTALDQASPWIIKLIVDLLTQSEQLDGQVQSQVYEYLYLLAGLSVLAAILLFFQRYLLITSSRKVEYSLRKNLFEKLQIQNRDFFDKNPTGDLMSRSTNDLDHVRDLVGPVILHIARMGLLLIYTGICLYLISPKIALVGLGFSLLLPLISMKFLKFLYKTHSTNQKFLAKLNTFLHESISGISIIKAHVIEPLFIKKFTERSEEFKQTSKKVAYTNSFIWPIIAVVSGLGICASLLLGSYLVQQGEMTIGDLSAAILYLVKVQFPLVGLGWVISLTQRGRASLDRIIELEDAMQTQEEYEYGEHFNGTFDQLELKDMSLTLSEVKVLDSINLTIKRGQSLGIVGATGSGKTLLSQVIAGIYPSSQGEVKLNQTPIISFNKLSYKRLFSIAPQDGFLFSDSIYNNIILGSQNTDSPTLDAEVQQAVEIADFTKDLPSIPNRLEARLGEKGINLSGGQKQRVGLSRALIANKEILILDDTLSALDTETEAQVLKNLTSQIKDLTSIVISHRYSSVSELDHIIVLDEGKIVEQGNHKQLLALQGLYWNTWEKQQITTHLAVDDV